MPEDHEIKGIDPKELDWPFELAQDTKKPYVEAPAERFAARFPKYIAAYKSESEPLQKWWDESWYHIEYKALAHLFTRDELTRLRANTCIMNTVGMFMEKDRLGAVVNKVGSSMWRWGMYGDDYNMLVRYYQGLQRFDFGEGFTTRLDWATGYNPNGYSVHHRLYLDGSFGWVIYRKGEPVLIIGFCVTEYGVLINQVQLLKKKGNRWLFKLPKPYMEHVIDRMAEAFPGEPLLLVDADAAVRFTMKCYENLPANWYADNAHRMLRSYGTPLVSWNRTTTKTIGGVEFWNLQESRLRSSDLVEPVGNVVEGRR